MQVAEQDLPPGHAAGIARGALVIAGLTILSRVLGLARTLVFSQRVGASCLGTAYVTANQVPNLVYELVLGGGARSEEHTSELQSHVNLVCRLLLEKKKKKNENTPTV